MPVLYFYLYNIFALYVVFVRLIRRAAPSHRIASIVRSAASIHGFLCLSFKFAISRRAVISPNRFNRSIFGILCLSFKFAISRRAVISPNRFNRSICHVYSRHFMSLFQIRDIASRRPLAPNRFNRSIFGILCLSFKFAISRRAVISPNRFNRSFFGVYVRLFMSSAAMQLGENTVASAYGIG